MTFLAVFFDVAISTYKRGLKKIIGHDQRDMPLLDFRGFADYF